MSRIALAIAPNSNTTLTVLGVTPAQIVLAGQDGKTQAVNIGECPVLDKAKAGDVVTLEVAAEGLENTYIIKSIETPKALGKTAASASRPCNKPMCEEYRQ
jgi:hypothetical protein